MGVLNTQNKCHILTQPAVNKTEVIKYQLPRV